MGALDDEAEEHYGGGGSAADASAQSQQQRAPTQHKRARVDLTKLHLASLPSAQMYERSYMHRSTVTHVVCTPVTGFVVTASTDGVLKFWKKMEIGASLDFVKAIKSHVSRVQSMVYSSDGQMLVTAAEASSSSSAGAAAGAAAGVAAAQPKHKSSLKVFDVINFDMVNVLKLEYAVASMAILDNCGQGLGDLFGNATSVKFRNRKLIAVVEQGTNRVRIYDPLRDTASSATAAATASGGASEGRDSADDDEEEDGGSALGKRYRLQQDTEDHATGSGAQISEAAVGAGAALAAIAAAGFARPIAVVEQLPHQSPIYLIAYNHHYDTVVTIDYDNVIEYWQFVDESDADQVSLSTAQALRHWRSPPAPAVVSFRSKLSTSLFEFVKDKAHVLSLDFNSGKDGSQFVTYSLDRKVRLFDFRSGKLLHTWDESLDMYQQLQKKGELGLENIDFGRRMAVEKEIQDLLAPLASRDNAGRVPGTSAEKREQNNTSTVNAIFDASGTFVLYATMIGIKVVSVVSK